MVVRVKEDTKMIVFTDSEGRIKDVGTTSDETLTEVEYGVDL